MLLSVPHTKNIKSFFYFLIKRRSGMLSVESQSSVFCCGAFVFPITQTHTLSRTYRRSDKHNLMPGRLSFIVFHYSTIAWHVGV